MAGCVLFTRTGLHIPMGWALFWVISTSVIQKKDDLMSGTRHSPMATREILPCSTHSFHTSLRLLNLITRGGTPQPSGSHALFEGLIVFSSIYLWLKHEMFIATRMSLRTWGIGPFRVITQQYAASFESRQLEDTRANVFPAGCPNIPSSVPFSQQLHDDHRVSHDPFCALAEFKVLLNKAKKLTSP